MIVRKTLFTKEIITSDELGKTCQPITRVAAMSVVRNPFAGQDQEELSDLFQLATELGPTMTAELVTMLPCPALSYGKAALGGSAGAMEHGAAVLHPKLGAPVRAAIGGGQALMPSNHKVGAMGDRIDLPLGHKDDPWSFDFIDTMTLNIADAPRADELILCVALSDDTRVHPRVGARPKGK
ncbi:amino acid synthesis family protein [Tropicibacter sp. R16_0]|uniref:amino acid synthesis family protein n=1 Tax=Tropicibacter sp. R16_0 TaxID=2821102 RepID=UPI001AD9B511|nr:amino acid synthesis family protein [Tropicibacter sp. R16_0]MBO9453044.1 amino acid synthesis family protein [Tropicibacter sp. R16_0]